MPLTLYHLSQTKNNDYDTYDSAVVAATSEHEARYTHPSRYEHDRGEWWNDHDWGYNDWVHPNDVSIRVIGTADEGVKPGVVCSSFNAG